MLEIAPNARQCTQTMCSISGMEYRQVSGQALGYQYGDPVVFAFSSGQTIDGYVYCALAICLFHI